MTPADVLAFAGLTVEQTRLLLRTGVAGPGTPLGGAVAYEEDAVLGLATRPELEAREVARVVPGGLYVARLGRDADGRRDGALGRARPSRSATNPR